MTPVYKFFLKKKSCLHEFAQATIDHKQKITYFECYDTLEKDIFCKAAFNIS